jgi:hypothetical protein
MLLRLEKSALFSNLNFLLFVFISINSLNLPLCNLHAHPCVDCFYAHTIHGFVYALQALFTHLFAFICQHSQKKPKILSCFSI